MLHIREIAPTRSTLREFVKYPLELYRGDESYAMMPVEQQVRGLLGRHNAMITNGVQNFLMAYDGEKPLGRLLAGIDFRALQRLGERRGYISMYESVDSQEVASALFRAARVFLQVNGITSIVGPTPPMFDDFGAGLLAEGFDSPPSFLSPYNPAYYNTLFQGAGFEKFLDYYTYDIPLSSIQDGRYESVLQRAGKRFGFAVENVNLRRDLKLRSREFARVIAESTPPEWEMIPPTSEELYRELKNIRHVLWPEYVLLARAGERPVGLMLVVPDCNPVLRGLKGRMFPVGTFRMTFFRSYVKRLRSAMLYVTPEFQNKGVEAVLIQKAFQAAKQNGINSAEAAMIHEKNLKMQLGVEKLGGRVTRVHRQYRLNLKDT